MTDKDRNEDRILDYLSGRLAESEEYQLERELLAERHLALLDGAPPQAERHKLLERHVAELEAMLVEPSERPEALAALPLDDLEERALAAEAELLDAYVRGGLGRADRAWVEQLAGFSKRFRGRLADAVAIRDLPPPTPVVTHRPWWKISRIAAAAMLAIGIAYWSIPRGPQPPPQVIVLSTVSRDSNIEPHVIQKHTKSLTFKQAIPPGSGTVFEVTLKDPEGKEIYRQPGLRRSQEQAPLVWTVSAASFPEGIYTLQYQGFSESGEPVEGDMVEFDLRNQVRPD